MSLRIIDLQRRLREIGRIRIGEKVPTRDGGQRPAKIDVFRFTSRDEQVIRAAAQQWGGTPEPWPDGPGGNQWQVRSKARQIDVIIPPGDMSFSQAYEQWTAGGCQVRCNGQWDHIGDQACHCDPEDRACNIHTRLSVIVPDLPGLGVWRLETHGYYAAVELGGIVDIYSHVAASGTMLPARLRLEDREVKRPINGKVATLKFVVPVLDLDVHPLSLIAGDDNNGHSIQPARRSLTPVPPPDAAFIPSVAEQMAAIDDTTPKPRTNAAEPMPPTGLRPRTATEATQADTEPQDEPPPEPVAVVAYSPADLARLATRVFHTDYETAPRGDKTRTIDRLRHAAIHACTHGRTATSKDCTPGELARVANLLRDIADGHTTYTHDQADTAGVTFTLPSGRTATVLWTEIEPAETN